MKSLTLEKRVMVWSAALVAIVLCVVGGGGALFLYNRAVGDIDGEARGVADHFFQLVREHGGSGFNWDDRHEVQEWLPGEHQGDLVELHRNGGLYYRSSDLGEMSLPAGSAPQFVQTPQGRMRVASFGDMGVELRVAMPTYRLARLVSTFLIILLAGLPVVLAFVILGGRWIAARALEPVRRITAEAEGITSQHLDRRVSVPIADDEIQRLAIVLNGTLGRLESSFQQAMRFSADASHELKTPLTVLHGDIEALLGSPSLGDADRAMVADILETAKRLNAITKSLLLLSRTDSGHLQLELQPVDFAEVIDNCVYDARIMAEARRITLEAELPKQAAVLGDALRLSQIVSNLLDNAVKYNDPHGKIRVTLTSRADEWVLDVANTGPGIPPGQASRIFERFSRGDQHAGISGHGLGLSLCAELAKAHGSKIELLPSDGVWTRFRFTLGAAREPNL